MIYAHIGICKYNKITPNYSKSVQEVYTEFWRGMLLEEPGGINLLTCVGDTSSTKNRYRNNPSIWDIIWGTPQSGYDLPPWVPDFQAKIEPPSLTERYCSVPGFSDSAFSVSVNLPERAFRVCSHSNLLTLYGFHFDTASAMSECTRKITNDHSILQLLSLMLSMLENGSLAYPSTEEKINAIWKTMAILTEAVGDKAQYPVAESSRERFASWMLYSLALPRAIGKYNKRIASQNAALEKLHDLDKSGLIPSHADVKSEAEAFREAQVARINALRKGREVTVPAYSSTKLEAISFGVTALNHMRLFRTEGFYVGKGPQSMQAGDEI